MTPFTIVVDSSCDLPPEYIREHGIEVLPMPFELDGREHNLGYWQEITDKEFYGALRKGGVAKTSQINPGYFNAVFTEYASQGREAVFIILSSGLSATSQCAALALEEVKQSWPDCKIFVIDSIYAASGIGLLVMLAVEKRSEGLTAGETALWLETKKHSCFGFFTVDDLMYLHRGGRLSKLSAIAGSALGIKPVLVIMPDGALALKDKTRGQNAALKLMVEHMKRCIDLDAGLDTVLINHTDCPETARTIAGLVESAVNVKNIIILAMGPVIGAHVGPGSIALVFEGSITREEFERRLYG